MTAAPGEATSNLTGVWQGRYFYPRLLPPVSFVATLIETASRLTGAVSEPGPRNDGAMVEAMLLGHHEGSAISFVKTYDLTPQPQPIDYTGSLSADAMEIEGTWRIGRIWSGTFLMIRSRPAPASVSRKAVERV